MSGEFEIRKAVRAVMDETDLASPAEIAAKVAESVPSNRLRSVLAFVLRDYVRVEFGRARMVSSQPPPVSRSGQSGGSAKVTSIRDAGPGWLRERVHVGGTDWLMLGECSYEQLKFLQSERQANAARSTAAATRYGRLAGLVRRHKVARVADLPKTVLASDVWQLAS